MLKIHQVQPCYTLFKKKEEESTKHVLERIWPNLTKTIFFINLKNSKK